MKDNIDSEHEFGKSPTFAKDILTPWLKLAKGVENDARKAIDRINRSPSKLALQDLTENLENNILKPDSYQNYLI